MSRLGKLHWVAFLVMCLNAVGVAVSLYRTLVGVNLPWSALALFLGALGQILLGSVLLPSFWLEALLIKHALDRRRKAERGEQ